jgi:hypothetical protein
MYKLSHKCLRISAGFFFFSSRIFFCPPHFFPRISRPGSTSLAEHLPVGPDCQLHTPFVTDPELRTSLATPTTTGNHNSSLLSLCLIWRLIALWLGLQSGHGFPKVFAWVQVRDGQSGSWRKEPSQNPNPKIPDTPSMYLSQSANTNLTRQWKQGLSRIRCQYDPKHHQIWRGISPDVWIWFYYSFFFFLFDFEPPYSCTWIWNMRYFFWGLKIPKTTKCPNWRVHNGRSMVL